MDIFSDERSMIILKDILTLYNDYIEYNNIQMSSDYIEFFFDSEENEELIEYRNTKDLSFALINYLIDRIGNCKIIEYVN